MEHFLLLNTVRNDLDIFAAVNIEYTLSLYNSISFEEHFRLIEILILTINYNISKTKADRINK